MSKKIQTIQSSDKKEFDRIINQHLEQGWDLVEGSYSVLEGVGYSQVVIFNKSGFNHFEFHDNGLIKEKGNYKDGKDGLWTTWYDNGQKKLEGTRKDGKLIVVTWWDEDGNVIKQFPPHHICYF